MAEPEDAENVSLDAGRIVTKKYLVNRLNYLNFQDQTILVNLRHSVYGNTVFLRVKPLPCDGDRLDCVWVDASNLKPLLRMYRFDYLLIPDGKKFLLVTPGLVSMDEETVSFALPVNCREYRMRRIKRRQSSGIEACFTQDGAAFHGELVDFTPVSLRVEGSSDPPETFPWVNLESKVNLHLYSGARMLYSGACEIVRQDVLRSGRTFVLAISNSNVRRYRTRAYRNARQHLIPSPNVVFEHPLYGRTVNLMVTDISGSGKVSQPGAPD